MSPTLLVRKHKFQGFYVICFVVYHLCSKFSQLKKDPNGFETFTNLSPKNLV